jgi:SpoIID/LytB domain protein
VGKELEIRRWLSRSHLYSSAFVVSAERDASGLPARFILHGAGWGHGIGLCQIGAAVMATKKYSAEDILKHYFRGTRLQKLY